MTRSLKKRGKNKKTSTWSVYDNTEQPGSPLALA